MLLETVRYDWVWCIFTNGIMMVVCMIAQTGHFRVLQQSWESNQTDGPSDGSFISTLAKIFMLLFG